MTPTPSSTPDLSQLTVGPFRAVAWVDRSLAWDRPWLHIAPDGVMCLVTEHEIYKLVDDVWTLYFAEPKGSILGIDHLERVWMANEGFDQISAWDGAALRAEPTRLSSSQAQDKAWTSYSADKGWTPLTRWLNYAGFALVDSQERIWFNTSQDVRVWDGERWTVFTPESMSMDALEEEVFSNFSILEGGGRVWVSECNWSGPGPVGGLGVRWLDSSADLTGAGQNWHGADSPVASGCADILGGDSLGRVWLAVEDELWRYDGDWTLFAPPEGLRIGAISDLALDPEGNPWVTFTVCGGASCDGLMHYYVRDGVWTQIEGAPYGYYSVRKPVFDTEGTPWLFWDDNLYRMVGDTPELVADFEIFSSSTDSAGGAWFVALHQDQAALWVLGD
jgi:ligand-binding sensor domain-containing protein